jgi:hypothetical protein
VGGAALAGYTVTLDSSRGPKALDLRRGNGEATLCAYDLEGDTLTLACHPTQKGAGRRPAGLKPGRGVCIEVLRRLKPKPKAP